jgi:nitroreductase
LMSDLMRIIKERRSIRKYQDKEISDDILNELLESIRWAPSWANSQCWEIIVVKDLSSKEKLSEILSQTNPARKTVIQAPVVLGICGRLKSSGYYKEKVTTKLGDWFMFDLGLATQNLCLTAHDLGLGSVIVGLFDHDKAKGVLNVGDDYELVALVPLGYPAKDSPVTKRREINEFTHYERF